MKCCSLDDLGTSRDCLAAGATTANGHGMGAGQKKEARGAAHLVRICAAGAAKRGGHERDGAWLELEPAQLCMAHGTWCATADGAPSTPVGAQRAPPTVSDGGESSSAGSLGDRASCATTGTVASVEKEKRAWKLHAPRLGFCLPAEEKGAALHFVPALDAGVPLGSSCGSLVRVRFALRMLPPGCSASPVAASIPRRPPVGTPLLTPAAEGGGATAGGSWPSLMPLAQQRLAVFAWCLSGVCVLGGLLLLLDLACVAPVVEKEGGWNSSTTRAFGAAAGSIKRPCALCMSAVLPGPRG